MARVSPRPFAFALVALALSCPAAFAQTEQSEQSSSTASTTTTTTTVAPDTRYCEFYNDTCRDDASACREREECQSESDKRNYCFALWHVDNATNKFTVRLKGCFTHSKECFNRTQCVESAPTPRKDSLLFCCCGGDMCNADFRWSPQPTEPPRVGPTPEKPQEKRYELEIVLIVIGFAGALLFVAVAACCFANRCKRKNSFDELPTVEPSLSCPPSPEGLDDGAPMPIVLREVRAHGRFGAVWRAHLDRQEVAVKVFPVQDKQSWLSEQEIYKLPRMNHPDILQFIGVEKRGDNLQAEYWLVTAYHEKGSLCDFLKANTVSWDEAYQIAFTMARGLTHLHDELFATGPTGGRKPAVAHRDFKSKNVLLKSDMSACIADFGLALIFQPGIPCGDTHGQVGTRRYMAPEILEGAINFTRDAFLRIDMYACGLVLWEIASRCTACGPPNEYALPLEEEVGAHPSLEEMQDAVVLRKLRPSIPDSWREHNAMYVLCDTMEECWDHDAEARLSASCVMERVASLRGISRRTPTTRAGLFIENARPLLPHD